jgi:DNA excision repair protein ERCC-2
MSGFGKTSPVLAGSLLAAKENGSRVIYACRTKRQVFRVMEEVQRIQGRLHFGAVPLYAKLDYCLLKETSSFTVNQDSFKWYCDFHTSNNLCSYFLNISLLGREVEGLVQRFQSDTPNHSQLLEFGRQMHVCPYEVTRLAVASSNVIVTTYHYLLNQAAKSLLMSSTGWNPSQTIAIIDEAHNLRDFVRDLSSTRFAIQDIHAALNDARALNMETAISFLEELTSKLQLFSAQQDSWYVDREELLQTIKAGHDDVWLPNIALELSTCAGVGWQSISSGRNLPTSIMKAGTFIRELLSSPEGGLTITRSDDHFYLVDTNPSRRFLNLIEDFRSLVLLSATINPQRLFLKSIGLDESTPIHQVNPTQMFRVRTIIDTGVSTRFKLRNSDTYSKIAGKISAIRRAARGSIGVFVPSYAVLDSLSPYLQARTGQEILAETRGLSNTEAEKMMGKFKSNQGSILLAVQGARFSEGEDFPGDQMDASVVVGFSLPPPSPMMYAELADSRFNKHETYLVVSLLPAVRKAIQAAGRHIRSPDKKGMVFFMDSRFNQPEVMQMIPAWLKNDIMVGDFKPEYIEQIVKSFFDNQ